MTLSKLNLESVRVGIVRVLLLLTLTVITWLATTDSPQPLVDNLWDKGNHVFAFFVLAGLLDFSFPKRTFGLFVIIMLLGYGVLIELIQWWLPQRYFSLFDGLADAIGVLIYLSCIPVINKTALATWRLKAYV